MCYNVSKIGVESILDKLKKFNIPKASNFDQILFQGHLFPTLPVYLKSENSFDGIMAQWGLVPNWVESVVKANDIKEYTLNAQIETANEKPSYRHLVNSSRCILPVSGFFEWKEVKKQKYPYFIYPSKQNLFFLAGLIDIWTHPITKEILPSFTLLTTEANDFMAEIHNRKKRMPVILSEDKIETYFSPDKELISFSNPFNQELMTAHSITKDILKVPQSELTLEHLLPYHYDALHNLFDNI